MGDTFTMSGDFRGAIVNIKSTLTQSAQTVREIPRADIETKQELEALISKLQTALEQVPPEHVNDAEAVALQAKQLTDAANQEKPNQRSLQITADGLKSAAKALAVVVPSALDIATKIVTVINRIGI